MKKLLFSLLLAIGLIVTPLAMAIPGGSDPPILVTAEEPEVKISEVMEVDNPNMELSSMTAVSKESAFMKLYSGISVVDTTRVWNDIMYLKENTGIRDVYFFINSPGGSAFDGLALANWVDFAQQEWGFTFHAQASGIIASAAVPIFAVCKNRMAVPGTIFMVHEAAIWKWPGRETASDIRSQSALMEILQTKYLQILVDHSNLTLEEWKEKEGRTTWFGVEQAEEWGLITRGDN